MLRSIKIRSKIGGLLIAVNNIKSEGWKRSLRLPITYLNKQLHGLNTLEHYKICTKQKALAIFVVKVGEILVQSWFL